MQPSQVHFENEYKHFDTWSSSGEMNEYKHFDAWFNLFSSGEMEDKISRVTDSK